MAIDFPTSKYTVAVGVSQNSWPGSPSSGDTATANSYTYTYNGTLWVMNNGSTKSFTGGATYTWDGEKWDASNIPNNSKNPQQSLRFPKIPETTQTSQKIPKIPN